MRGGKNGKSRRWFVIAVDRGRADVVWQGTDPGDAWAFKQGFGGGIVCGEWVPDSPDRSPARSPESRLRSGTRASRRVSTG